MLRPTTTVSPHELLVCVGSVTACLLMLESFAAAVPRRESKSRCLVASKGRTSVLPALAFGWYSTVADDAMTRCWRPRSSVHTQSKASQLCPDLRPLHHAFSIPNTFALVEIQQRRMMQGV